MWTGIVTRGAGNEFTNYSTTIKFIDSVVLPTIDIHSPPKKADVDQIMKKPDKDKPIWFEATSKPK